jgi:hypothetical protein
MELSVEFYFLDEEKPSTTNFFGQKQPSTFYFSDDFYFSTISQFQLKTAILTSFYLFSCLHQVAYSWEVFALCCSCLAVYGTVHTAICRPWYNYYLLIPWNRVLLEKLTSLHLVKKVFAFYRTRKFITAFTSACHPSLPWASSIQSIPHIPLPEDPF